MTDIEEELAKLNREKLYYFEQLEKLKADESGLLTISYLQGADFMEKKMNSRKCENCSEYIIEEDEGNWCAMGVSTNQNENTVHKNFGCKLWSKQDDNREGT